MSQENHALENAKAHIESMQEAFSKIDRSETNDEFCGHDECFEAGCTWDEHSEFHEYDEEGDIKYEDGEEVFRGGPGALSCAAHLECNNFEPITDARHHLIRERLEEELRESALSVQVRSGWYEPGPIIEMHGYSSEPSVRRDALPAEFEILLTWGGPALRIRGDLDEYGQPTRAYMEYQDWGTPWTQYFGEVYEEVGKTCLRFAELFYFGEG